ncbi:MAG: phosphate starvation-inducible protein PsiF [Betaproteobacteria bacterium]|nr:phosphate starvation-inducible protein PsiF [Betaproteobacteria bacterium]
MKTIVIAAMTVACLATVPAFGATQQEKMRTCNAEAKTQALKGQERRDFMSRCLAVSPEEKEARLARRQKAKSCAAEARDKSLKGEERKSYIAECVGT